MNARRVTIVLALITLAVLVFSAPSSLRDAYARGEFYIFSRAFFEDIPRRLTGPGRFRFLLQPLIAVILGIRGGRADAREGKPPFLLGLLFHPELRKELFTSGFSTLVNLLLMGILMDSVFQWVILGASYPGAALVVGPVLIVSPYALARAISNRLSRRPPDRSVAQDSPASGA